DGARALDGRDGGVVEERRGAVCRLRPRRVPGSRGDGARGDAGADGRRGRGRLLRVERGGDEEGEGERQAQPGRRVHGVGVGIDREGTTARQRCQPSGENARARRFRHSSNVTVTSSWGSKRRPSYSLSARSAASRSSSVSAIWSRAASTG